MVSHHTKSELHMHIYWQFILLFYLFLFLMAVTRASWSKDLKEREYLKGLGADKRIILKQILKKCGVKDHC